MKKFFSEMQFLRLQLGPFDIRVHVLVVAAAVLLLTVELAVPGIEIGRLSGPFFMLFMSLLLHEMAHSQAAAEVGLEVGPIYHFFLGGAAMVKGQYRSKSQGKWQRLQVSLAGPLINLVVAGLAWITLPDPFDPRIVTSLTNGGWVKFALPVQLLYINALLAIVNMVPMFPMDGGRVFEAAVSIISGREQSLWFSSLTSLFTGIGFAAVAWVVGDYITFVYVIAMFIVNLMIVTTFHKIGETLVEGW